MSFAEKGAAVSREQLLHALAMVFTIVQKRAVKVGGFVGCQGSNWKVIATITIRSLLLQSQPSGLSQHDCDLTCFA